jgi:hypothetical protein
MGFLSKKSMLVSLLALSLAACASKPIVTDQPIDLPCDGDAGVHKIDKTPQTIIFQTGSACKLQDVTFKRNSGGFKKHSPTTSPNAGVKYDYDGSPIPGDGAYFEYTTLPPGSSTDGSGGGIIKNK